MKKTQLGNRTDVAHKHFKRQARSTPTDGLTRRIITTTQVHKYTTGFGALEGRESEFVVNRRGGGAGSGGSGGGGDDRCLSGGSGAGALASCLRLTARRRSSR